MLEGVLLDRALEVEQDMGAVLQLVSFFEFYLQETFDDVLLGRFVFISYAVVSRRFPPIYALFIARPTPSLDLAHVSFHSLQPPPLNERVEVNFKRDFHQIFTRPSPSAPTYIVCRSPLERIGFQFSCFTAPQTSPTLGPYLVEVPRPVVQSSVPLPLHSSFHSRVFTVGGDAASHRPCA
jgi:hypothetical protein